jgi:hypothetical protein
MQMKIRMLRAYGLASPGQIIDPAPGVALLLIQRGIAVIYEGDEKPIHERWNKKLNRPPQEVRRGK